MPTNTHPMTLFNTAILSMQNESIFRRKYDEGMHKSEFWKFILEDGIQLISKLPELGAGIYPYRNIIDNAYLSISRFIFGIALIDFNSDEKINLPLIFE